ncbi:MFS transporter [Catellatospora tritici]|uniref:MFS transporter n=1 Tax=Catellatospora tritici TaxID=2851566 RepID=UPI0027E1A686|nr:MFS transporter [Catellatospora tritici]
MRHLTRLYCTLRACDEGVLFFPVYALLFADAGLDTAQITSLFLIWAGVSFALEVPSGAWADAFSRRRLLAFGALLRCTGFAVWWLWPTYHGFALGFVLWAVRSAASSGTKEALLYDELVAIGAAGRYQAVASRAATVAMLSMLVTTALAAPAYAFGQRFGAGYALIALGSMLACLGSAAAALALPEQPKAERSGDGVRTYLAKLRGGLAEARGDRTVRRALVVAALVPALSAFDEYVPLLVRDLGMATAGVPLVLALMMGAMAAGSALAERWRASPVAIGSVIVSAGVLLAAGALAGDLVGLGPIAVCFGLLQLTRVLTETRLQEVMSGSSRATVLSVAGFACELGALGVYGLFGLGSLWLDVVAVSALFAIPVVAVGLLASRWLPAGAGAAENAPVGEPV